MSVTRVAAQLSEADSGEPRSSPSAASARAPPTLPSRPAFVARVTSRVVVVHEIHDNAMNAAVAAAAADDRERRDGSAPSRSLGALTTPPRDDDARARRSVLLPARWPSSARGSPRATRWSLTVARGPGATAGGSGRPGRVGWAL